MNDLETMKKLKERYFELVERHGEDVTELKPFQKSLRELNKKHRLNAINMFEEIILKVEKKVKTNNI